MDIAQITLFIVIIILAILLLALGIQVFFILKEFRKTVSKANKVLDDTNVITHSVSSPISSLSGIVGGIKTVTPLLSFFKKIISKKEDSGKKIEEIEMENNNNKSGGNFFSGFLLGTLVGAGLVFLFGTEKGKKVLKAISEEGAENISNILDKIDKSVDLPDESLEDPSFASTFAKATVDKKASAGKGSNDEEEILIKNDKSKTRRFFRGISKRVN